MVIRAIATAFLLIVSCGSASAASARDAACVAAARELQKLSSRDAATEARRNAAASDYRPMAYWSSPLGATVFTALGLPCPRAPLRHRETLGYGSDGIPACVMPYLKAARAFIERYNVALAGSAAKEHRDVCTETAAPRPDKRR